MSGDLAYEGNTKVYFLPSVANMAAPTTAEIAAGTRLTKITKDGLKTPDQQNYIDTSDIDETYNSQGVGSWGGGPIEITIKRNKDDESNTYDLIVYGTAGYLLISRFGTPIAASKVEVWPIEMHEPTEMQTAKDEAQKFKAGFAVTSQPNKRAVVV